MVAVNVALGLISSVLSFIFFLLCRFLIIPLTYYRQSVTQKKEQRTPSPPYIRTWFTYPDEERWQRLNLLMSWFHALITGLLVIYSFWSYASELRRDFVTHVNLVTYLTCSVSFGKQLIYENNRIRFELFQLILGYFWYDLFDVISNRRGSDLYEIVLHHVFVSLVFVTFSFISAVDPVNENAVRKLDIRAKSNVSLEVFS